MEGIRKVVASIALFLATCLIPILAGCTCTLAACNSDVAEAERQSHATEAEQQSRFVVGEWDYTHLFVTTMTDTETGQKWVVVATYDGVAIAPIEERE